MISKNIVKIEVLIWIATLCLSGSLLRAQSTTQGAIAGTAFDASEAVVPNAKVTIRNDGTNAEIVLNTDGSGYYKATNLAPGTYTVVVSAPGFSELRSSNVVVQVNQVTEVDPHLTTGAATSVVEVTADMPVLNFESAAYGGHLATQEIESIPINNRRWSALAVTTPGVTPNSDGFGLLSFRAISPLLNNVQIDGADDNQAFFSEERGRTRAGYSTSQAAVREFQVNTGVYSAELGRAVGGVVNSVTKSGSNSLHGEIYFYNRNSSRSAFQPFATNTTYNATTGKYVTAPYRPKDNRNQYGFGVGGALIKDKLFWFYSFDEFKRNFPGTSKAANPSSFFAVPDAALPAGYTCNLSTGSISGSPAASTIDQNACLLAARLGYTTYASGAAAYNTQLQALLPDMGVVPRFGDQEINTPKLDYQLNSKEHVSFLYHRLRWDSPGGVQTSSTSNYAIDSFGTDFVKLDYGVAILESLFTTHLTNELRYQYGRELNDEGRQTPSAYTTQNFMNASGVPTYVSLLSASGNIGLNLGTPYYSFRTAYPDERKWQIGDTASYQLGNHNIRFGEDFVHNYDLQNNLFEGNGLYNYTTNIVNYFSDLIAKKGTCNAALSGIGTNSCYNSYVQGFGPAIFEVTTQDYGVFVQDDWKASPRLTLNLGLRYDYEKVPSPFAGLATLPQTQNVPSDKNNLAPRVGFSWDPFGAGKTVVHGGYGMFFGRIFNAFILNTYENTGSANSQSTYTYTPTTSNNGLLVAPTFPAVATSLPPAAATGPNIEFFDKNMQNPMAHEFDLAVQQELGFQNVLTISYLGALGRELPNYLNINLNNDASHTYVFPYVVGAGTNGSCGPVACGTTIPVKVYSNKTQTGATAGTYQLTTPYPAFNSVSDVISNINSSYHALTVEVTKRASRLISYDVNYTWAHALDFNQSTPTSPGTNNWFDPLGNARANYGNSSNNIKHRVVGWAVLNIPGLAGHSPLTYATNGWSIKPLVQAQSGLPYSLTVGGTVPNQCYVAGCLEANSSGLGGTGVTYIPAIGRNTYNNPRTIDIDMRIEKDFKLKERYNLELFGEAFNLANHQNVTGITSQGYTLNTVQPAAGNPAPPTSTLVYQSAFGSVTAANGNNSYQVRQVQIAARITF